MGERDFSAALLDPVLPVPFGVVDPEGRTDPKRFAVYRNNVVVGLTDALEEAFPTVRKLVGEEFFRDMGNIFVRAYPPKSPILAQYGADFAAFLDSFEPAASLPYLSDVARLDQMMRQSYHAGDAKPADPGALQAIAPDVLGAVRFTLAPAVQVFQSRWPVWSIWMANHANGGKVVMAPEDVLITRPLFDPRVDLLPVGGFAFLTALQTGLTLGEALGAAGAGFDLSAPLALLFKGGAITEIST
jgi:Putative DNA-binding domain